MEKSEENELIIEWLPADFNFEKVIWEETEPIKIHSVDDPTCSLVYLSPS